PATQYLPISVKDFVADIENSAPIYPVKLFIDTPPVTEVMNDVDAVAGELDWITVLDKVTLPEITCPTPAGIRDNITRIAIIPRSTCLIKLRASQPGRLGML